MTIINKAGFGKLGGKNQIWLAVIVAGLFVFLTMGVRQGFGLFLDPITREINVSREIYALAIAMQNLIWGVFSPVFGAIADRRGPVKIVAVGVAIYSGGLLLMGLGGGTAGLFSGQALVGIGLGGAGMSVMLGVVGKAAPPEKRSLALGMTAATGSLGQFGVVYATQELIIAFDWSVTLIILSVLMTSLFLLLPVLGKNSANYESAQHPQILSTLSCALKYKHYLLLIVGFFVCGFQVVFISTHLPVFLTDAGLSSRVSGLSLSLIGLFNLIGTLIFGYLGGRMSKKILLSGFYITRSVVIALFIFLPLTSTSALVFGGAIGFLWLGTVPLTSGLVANLFGTRNLTMLYGVVFLSHQAGSFMGAWLGGRIFASLGSYDLMWWLIIGAGVFAAVLHLPIRETLAPARFRLSETA